jgi:S1-C subfamily serine protease
MRYSSSATVVAPAKGHPLISTALLSLLLATGLAPQAQADEFAEKGRLVFQKNHAAVVTVALVQKSASGRGGAPRESKATVTGVVMDPSGMTVVALSSVDPAALIRRISPDYKVEVEISEVKIVLEDTTEIPAEIVINDTENDLTFIRPKAKPASPMTAIDFSKSGTAQILDQVVSLNRLKQAAGRAFCASEERISAVVQKPRLFYIPDSSITDTESGSPAFALDGSVLGMFVMRGVNAAGASSMRDVTTAIILPAADIVESAKQAFEAKPGDEKKDAPKDPGATPDAPK